MGRQHPVLFLALQISTIVIPIIGLVLAGIVLDSLAGTSPIVTLAFLALGVTLGTSLIVITVVKSFSQPSRPEQQRAGRQVPGRGF